MTMNPLPPQAYTKETLLKAYQWLMGQNTSIKEMATNPEILVSLFLKATRDGDAALDRPSIQNFKNELRSLAGMMTELDRKGPTGHPNTAVTPPPPAQAAAQISSSSLSQASPHLTSPAPSVRQTVHEKPKPQAPPAPEYSAPELHFEENLKTAAEPTLGSLDSATLRMIREVKADFNLSNDVEALRMLVKVGYVRAKGFLQ